MTKTVKATQGVILNESLKSCPHVLSVRKSNRVPQGEDSTQNLLKIFQI
jgi:hypothetical protein